MEVTPESYFFIRFSLINTIQLLGYPHGYGNPHIWLYPRKEIPMISTIVTRISVHWLRQASLPFTNLVQSFPPSPSNISCVACEGINLR